jgi:hypothetical protein
VGIESYVWTFYHDGEPVVLHGDIVDFVFGVVEDVVVELSVRDARGNEGTDTVTLHVVDREPPTFELDNETTVAPGEMFHLECRNWSDNVGVVSFQWRISGNGTPIVLEGSNVSLVLGEVGQYAAWLSVLDAEGNEATGLLFVNVVEPTDGVVDGDGQPDDAGTLGLFLVVLVLVIVLLVAYLALQGARGAGT